MIPELNIEGWCDGREASARSINEKIGHRLNAHLCEMKEGYDDSIVGLNEARDIVRAVLSGATAKIPASV